jgi:hypothetical protein
MANFGSWPTPITSELVVRAAAGLGSVSLHGGTAILAEQRGGVAPSSSSTRMRDRLSICCLRGSTPAPPPMSTAGARGGLASSVPSRLL